MAQVGMVVEYLDVAGDVTSPAFVNAIDDSGNVVHILWPKGGSPQWQQSPSGLVRDDTLSTNNSWRPVVFIGSTTMDSGV